MSGLKVQAVVLFCCAVACAGSHRDANTAAGELGSGGSAARTMRMRRANPHMCPEPKGTQVVNARDTRGDEGMDVYKVMRVVGEAPDTRLISRCREVDVNGDGIFDVARFYSERGEPLTERADRDLDGYVEETRRYQNRRTARREIDANRDGHVDIVYEYREGRLFRIERDTKHRSQGRKWRPDRWEYYEKGKLARIGIDIDGDGQVDRWDRAR